MTGHRFSGWIVPLLAALVASLSAPAVAESWEPLRLWRGEVPLAAARGTAGDVDAALLARWILALEVGADSTLWASAGAGVFTSEDGGESFRSHLAGLGPMGFLERLAIHPQQPQIAYAFGCCVEESYGLLRTVDGGWTWELLPYGGVLREAKVIAVDPEDPEFVYAGGLREGRSSRCTAVRSTDGGATWSCMGPPSDFTDLVIDPRDPRVLHGLFDGVLHRSVDRGRTWKRVSAQARALDHLTPDPARRDRFFALSRIGPGVWRSDDAGRSWKQLAAGLPANGVVHDLLLDPSRPDRVWIAVEVFRMGKSETSATSVSRVFRSDDAGGHWTEVSDGLAPGVVVLHLAADPEGADVLYAGTAGQGVYRLVVE